jgi:DNA-directed RNA polymerase subunit M/transcription elongation factor TFIIS
MRIMRGIAALLLLGGVSLGADKLILKKPPKSLDRYYPPKSEKFEFLNNMYLMSTSFYGINLNINEGNWKGALEWAQRLRDTYKKTSKMVPEWKNYFKPELADRLVKAVKSKNVDRVIKASKALGQTCAKCHRDQEIVVKLIYHYPSFEDLKLEDPVEFMEMKVGKYMEKMTNSLKALRIYLMQGEKDKAQEAGTNFVERMRGLRAMCSKCHTDKASEEIYMGKNLESALTKLEELLSADKIDNKAIFSALDRVSMTCAKCHNVHLVPAMVQEALGK